MTRVNLDDDDDPGNDEDTRNIQTITRTKTTSLIVKKKHVQSIILDKLLFFNQNELLFFLFLHKHIHAVGTH